MARVTEQLPWMFPVLVVAALLGVAGHLPHRSPSAAQEPGPARAWG